MCILIALLLRLFIFIEQKMLFAVNSIFEISIIMDNAENADSLELKIKEFMHLLIKDGKLMLIEAFSLVAADFFAFVLILFFATAALFFVLLAVVWLLSFYLGFPVAMLAVALLLLLLCAVVYIMRNRLFVNIIVGRLCSIFLKDDEHKG